MQRETKYIEVKDPYGFIYITTNLVNGKRYLGQKCFDRKWKNYLGSGVAFRQALNKYGKENFRRSIVDIAYSAEELNKKEYKYSLFFDVVESNDWYNLVYGGGTTAGMITSEETRIKQSEVRKRNSIIHPEYDEHHSQRMIEFYKVHPEVKDQMSNTTKQLWQNQDYASKILQSCKEYWSNSTARAKQSEMMKEIWKNQDVRDARLNGLKEWVTNPENHNARSEISKRNWENPEYREAQINRNIGSKNPMYGVHRYGIDSPRAIPVYCIELNRIFWGAKEAEKTFHIKGSDITQCCKRVSGHNSAGKDPITKEKLHWMYAIDAIEQMYITQKQLNDYLEDLRNKGE